MKITHRQAFQNNNNNEIVLKSLNNSPSFLVSSPQSFTLISFQIQIEMYIHKLIMLQLLHLHITFDLCAKLVDLREMPLIPAT